MYYHLLYSVVVEFETIFLSVYHCADQFVRSFCSVIITVLVAHPTDTKYKSMGASHSRKKHIHNSIHLSGIPTTAISSEDHQSDHNTPQTIQIPTSSTSQNKSKAKSKWMSFKIFNHMKQITNAIQFSAESMRMEMETPHSIATPDTTTGETEDENSNHPEIDDHDKDNQEVIHQESNSVTTKGVDLVLIPPPRAPSRAKLSTRESTEIQETEEIITLKEHENPEFYPPLTRHRCWFIGNNEHGQFGATDDFTQNESILSLSLMVTISDVHIDKIITSHNGTTRILYNHSKFMDVSSDPPVSNHNRLHSHSGCLTVTAVRIICNHWYYQECDYLENLSNCISHLIVLFTKQDEDIFTDIETPSPNKSATDLDIRLISGGICSDQLFIKTKNNELYAKISHHSHTTPAYNLQAPLKQIKYFQNECIDIKQIESTSYNTIFLSKMGELYTCNGIKKDGEDNIDKISISFEYTINMYLNGTNTKIDSITCGADHTLAMTMHGQIYSFGFNGCGQLGHGNNGDKFAVYQPTLIQHFIMNNIPIVQISAGSYHNMVLDNDGNVYTFGANNVYQCGNGCQYDVFVPEVRNEIDGNAIDIKCGYEHNVVYCENGDYWLWGNNEFNQCLVYDENEKYIKIPRKYDCASDIYKHFFPGEIVTIYPGWKETRIITT